MSELNLLDALHKFLDYDPTTGIFIWKVSRSRAKAGNIAGSSDGDGYLKIRIDGRAHRAHRLAWLYMTGEWPANQIDHINGVRSDNRWTNLREATSTQNNANRSGQYVGSSGYKGVAWHKRNKCWYARIGIGDGKQRYLGQFAEIEDAHAAYCLAAEQHFGPFARTE